MSDRQTICDEMVAAREKATGLPWTVVEGDSFDLILKMGEDDVWQIVAKTPPKHGRYVTLAANNADRLARFARIVCDQMVSDLRATAGVSEEQAKRRVDRLWEESK